MNDPRRDADNVLQPPLPGDEADVDAMAALFAEAAPAQDEDAVERLAAFAATQRPGVARRGKSPWVWLAAAASVAAFALVPRGPADAPDEAVVTVVTADATPPTPAAVEPVAAVPVAVPERGVAEEPVLAAQAETAGPLGEDPRDVLAASERLDGDELWDDWAMAEVGAEALLDEPHSML